MLRDGSKCMFDPVVLMDALTAAMDEKASDLQRQLSTDTTRFVGCEKDRVRSAIRHIFPDKTWVDVFYQLEEGVDIRLEINSYRYGSRAMRFILATIDRSILANVLYDKFGMIPINVQNPFYTEEWVRRKILGTFITRDIDMFTRLVEDQCLRAVVTKQSLEKLIKLSIGSEWPEATAVLMRAIHDRDDGIDNVETMLRL